MPLSYRATVERNVGAKMRDGTILYADVWRPEQPGRYPVLLQRLPYNKEAPGGSGALDPLRATGQGYVVIVQDTRGRYASQGHFHPFFHEANDGYDSVEWAAELAYSNGKVGMFGSSYGGATQWLAAIKQPPHLKAIFPQITASQFYEGWTYRGGAFELGFTLYWTLWALAPGLFYGATSNDEKENETKIIALKTRLNQALANPWNQYEQLPVKDSIFWSDLAPYYLEWLNHPRNDDFWQRICISDYYTQVTVPVYNLGGWYDLFLTGTLNNFSGMRNNSLTQKIRNSQKLLIGPWSHGNTSEMIGDLEFGSQSSLASFDPTDLQLNWFNYWLKDNTLTSQEEPPIKLFVMGLNQWRDESEWPLARTNWQKFYLHSQGHANTRAGDGILSQMPPNDEPSDVYTYDPTTPVPTWGGATYLPGLMQGRYSGPKNQAKLEARQDVLIYTTLPLEEDLEVTGPIKVMVYASTTAPDTDWTAKLVDVWPEGQAYNLVDGIIRGRYRENTVVEKLLEPNSIYPYTIEVGATSNVFKAGHQIRLQISSSNFPRFDRNPNTGREIAVETELVPAIQTVFHDFKHQSYLLLPVIPVIK